MVKPVPIAALNEKPPHRARAVPANDVGRNLVADEDPERRGMSPELAGRIVAKSAVAVSTGKRMVYTQLEKGMEAAYDYAAEVMACNMMTEDVFFERLIEIYNDHLLTDRYYPETMALDLPIERGVGGGGIPIVIGRGGLAAAGVTGAGVDATSLDSGEGVVAIRAIDGAVGREPQVVVRAETQQSPSLVDDVRRARLGHVLLDSPQAGSLGPVFQGVLEVLESGT